jgi:hypothetical protein
MQRGMRTRSAGDTPSAFSPNSVRIWVGANEVSGESNPALSAG